MGFLKDRHGIMLVGQTPPGTCPMCAVNHPPEQPHNRDSMTYQYRFYDEHGRWPTWGDAMSHCREDVKAYWKDALIKNGIPAEEFQL